MNDVTTEINLTETSTTVAPPEMTYDEKMSFLLSIRHEIGLEKVRTEDDDMTNEAPKGKYCDTVYSMGTF